MYQPYLVVGLIVTAIAAWTDWRTGNIPNWLTFGTILFAPILHIIVGFARHQGSSDAFAAGGYSIVGMLACGSMPVLLYRRGAMGGGDVKLFAAIGALLRTVVGIEAEMYCLTAAALLAPAHLAYEGKLFVTLKNSLWLVVNPFLPAEKKHLVEMEAMSWLRLGPSIFLGMVVTTLLYWRT